VRSAGSIERFLADPVGHYYQGRSFVVWVQTPFRIGSSYFERLDPADHPAIAALFSLPVSPALETPYDVLHDLEAIEVFDRTSYSIFEAFLRLRVADVAARARRLAVVRPSGLAGAAFAGLYYEHVRPHMEGGLFADRFAALDWLGLARDGEERQEIEALTAACEGLEPPLRGLREYLSSHLSDATVMDAARTLATSARSLQRRLAAHRTAFRDELHRARLRAAEGLLLESDEKIESIARHVGFGTDSSFTTAFRRATGCSPGEFRERQGALSVPEIAGRE
jgi:AraC-like DNA-binding protein